MKLFVALIALLSLALEAEGRATLKGAPKGTAPTPPPTVPSASLVADKALATLQQARPVIEDLIAENGRLIPLFIRLGFHDCITVCDGCLDLSDVGNYGLGIPVDALDPVVTQFVKPGSGVSRADMWAFAASVAADAAPHGAEVTQPINFTITSVGRVDCENANKKCVNAKGKQVPCSATAGPYRLTPSVNYNAQQTFEYFGNEFDFSQDDTVTIMGIHALGRLAKNNSGISGPNGWDANQTLLSNEYFQALLGPPVLQAPAATLTESFILSESQAWVRHLEVNDGHPFPNRSYWITPFMNETFVMLNPDIAMARDLNSLNTNPDTGVVSCTFVTTAGTPTCPLASTFDLVYEYAEDNTFWLSSLQDVFARMLMNGYDAVDCGNVLCGLVPRP